MKKKNIKLIILGILLVITLGIASLNNLNTRVKADSGWDSDYDSGWDSGSSWDSDSSWSSSSGSYGYSGGSGEPASPLGIAIVVIFIIVIYIISAKKGGAAQMSASQKITNFISEDEIRKLLPDFNKTEFLEKAYKIFIDVQNAWMDFDYDTLRKNLSDELFNTYKSQLKTLSIKKQKNIMSDFNKLAIEVTGINQNEGKTTLTVDLVVSFYDYVVDANEKVVRGQKSIKLTNHYQLAFISSAQVKKNANNKCPNCNAPLDNVASNKCPYCKSTIVSEHYDWVLSKKEIKR